MPSEMKITAVLDAPELLLLEEALKEIGVTGVRVEIAQSALDALQLYYIHGIPDLMVIDLDDPKVQNLATLQSMRLQPEFIKIPLLLVSAAFRPGETLVPGPTKVLAKPGTVQDFSERLSALLGIAAVGSAPPWYPAPPGSGGRPTDARKAPRKSLPAPCVISTAGKKIPATLLDISLTGARVRTKESLNLSNLVTLLVGVPKSVPLKIVQFKALVVRRGNQEYGLAFREMDTESHDFVYYYTR